MVFQSNDSKNVFNNYSLYIREMNDKKWERKIFPNCIWKKNIYIYIYLPKKGKIKLSLQMIAYIENLKKSTIRNPPGTNKQLLQGCRIQA